MLILSIIICILYAFIYKYIRNYNKSSYHKITNNSITEVFSDKGKLGEYLTYRKLSIYEETGDKFLFNLYIPAENNKTTEIDIIMITKKGIIVFESKNYSGWIFGDEQSKMWIQTLPKGRGKSYKSQFYNPILQNKKHINYLKKILDENVPIFSIITFSDRCTLKKVPQNTNDIKVINRYNVDNLVREIYENNPDLVNEDKINVLFHKLFIYTQTNKKIKQDHIQKIGYNK